MKTRKEVAELVAMLALRSVGTNRQTVLAREIVADSLKLCRLAASAETQALNLCNIPNYQARADKKLSSIEKQLAPITIRYNLTSKTTRDPRGYCVRLFAVEGTPALPGNTWGGDESGYGI